MKNNLLTDKKAAVTGLPLAFTIISIFIILGVWLPFIAIEFDQSVSSGLADGLEVNVGQASGELTSVSAIDIVISIAKMFTWTFGILPFWLDGIFLIFRIMLVAIVIQYLPFVG